MRRRLFLSSTAALGIGSIAGCSSDDEGVRDSDGDGVIDSQDYAPNDPEVQEKGDLQDTELGSETTESTPTASPTSTATPTPTETPPPTATPTPTPVQKDANVIEADTEQFPETSSHFVEYSTEGATVFVHPEESDDSDLSSKDIWVIASDYPQGEVYAYGHTSISSVSNSGKAFSVEVEWDSPSTVETFHYWLLLAPEGTAYEDLSGSNTEYLRETDPFTIGSDGVRIEEATVSELDDVQSDEGESFERTVREGEFRISMTGETQGREWDVGYYIYKSAYVSARRRDHGRSRREFVAYESASGIASTIAGILDDAAVRNGFEEKRMKVEFVIDVIQHIPYVPDDVSTGYDDYTKYGGELMVELAGDCEDTAIMLASVLQAEPFGYDMILIQPPGHMAAGIYGGDDLPGHYWEVDGRKYYYIETTGVGWGIGDLPETYEGTSAYTYQV